MATDVISACWLRPRGAKPTMRYSSANFTASFRRQAWTPSLHLLRPAGSLWRRGEEICNSGPAYSPYHAARQIPSGTELRPNFLSQRKQSTPSTHPPPPQFQRKRGPFPLWLEFLHALPVSAHPPRGENTRRPGFPSIWQGRTAHSTPPRRWGDGWCFNNTPGGSGARKLAFLRETSSQHPDFPPLAMLTLA